MTKREAKRWACGMAADLVQTDMGNVIDDEDPDRYLKRAAMMELVVELNRRSDKEEIQL